MKRNKRKLSFFLILILWISVIGCFISSSNVEAAKKKNTNTSKKAIYFVLDNSSSMVRDDNTGSYKNARWSFADYSVKAFASMIGEGDTFKLYQFVGDKLELCSITGGKEKDFDTVVNKLDNLEYASFTFSTGIINAAESLNKEDGEQYLVVFSDGKINDDRDKYEEFCGQYGYKQYTDNKILFSDLLSTYKNLHIINIQKDEEAKEDGRLRQYAYTDETITDTINKAINKIYGRVEVPKNDEDIISIDKDKVVLDFSETDVPISELRVFIQYNGKIQSLNSYNPILQFGENDVDVDTSQKPLYFNVRSNTPAFNSKYQQDETIIKNKVQVADLHGAMITFENVSEKKITIPYSISKNTSELPEVYAYYTPAYKTKVTFIQNDKEFSWYLEDGNNDSSMQLTEDPLTIKVSYVNTNNGTEKVIKKEKGLLKLDDLSVQLSTDGTFLERVESNEKGEYLFASGGKVLPKSASGSSVIIVNGFDGKQYSVEIPAVKESRKNIEIYPMTDSILTLDHDGNGFITEVVSITNKNGIPLETENSEEIREKVCSIAKNISVENKSSAKEIGDFNKVEPLSNDAETTELSDENMYMVGDRTVSWNEVLQHWVIEIPVKLVDKEHLWNPKQPESTEFVVKSLMEYPVGDIGEPVSVGDDTHAIKIPMTINPDTKPNIGGDKPLNGENRKSFDAYSVFWHGGELNVYPEWDGNYIPSGKIYSKDNQQKFFNFDEKTRLVTIKKMANPISFWFKGGRQLANLTKPSLVKGTAEVTLISGKSTSDEDIIFEIQPMTSVQRVKVYLHHCMIILLILFIIVMMLRALLWDKQPDNPKNYHVFLDFAPYDGGGNEREFYWNTKNRFIFRFLPTHFRRIHFTVATFANGLYFDLYLKYNRMATDKKWVICNRKNEEPTKGNGWKMFVNGIMWDNEANKEIECSLEDRPQAPSLEFKNDCKLSNTPEKCRVFVIFEEKDKGEGKKWKLHQ